MEPICTEIEKIVASFKVPFQGASVLLFRGAGAGTTEWVPIGFDAEAALWWQGHDKLVAVGDDFVIFDRKKIKKLRGEWVTIEDSCDPQPTRHYTLNGRVDGLLAVYYWRWKVVVRVKDRYFDPVTGITGASIEETDKYRAIWNSFLRGIIPPRDLFTVEEVKKVVSSLAEWGYDNEKIKYFYSNFKGADFLHRSVKGIIPVTTRESLLSRYLYGIFFTINNGEISPVSNPKVVGDDFICYWTDKQLSTAEESVKNSYIVTNSQYYLKVLLDRR